MNLTCGFRRQVHPRRASCPAITRSAAFRQQFGIPVLTTRNKGIAMAKTHFAIERPRKISISIEGYNAEAQTQAQKRKQQERTRRLNRKADAAAKRQRKEHPEAVPAHVPTLRAEDVDEVEALSRAAASKPLASDVERQVRAALAQKEVSHANE